jgi:hypothetical protein
MQFLNKRKKVFSLWIQIKSALQKLKKSLSSDALIIETQISYRINGENIEFLFFSL